jgi:hypothetical protein
MVERFGFNSWFFRYIFLTDPLLEVGRKAYLSTENLNLPKAWARKLMPKYISPSEIISCERETSHYTLALPVKLLKHRIHPKFHTKLLRLAILNDNEHFPNQEATFFYNFGDNPKRAWLINSIVDHKFMCPCANACTTHFVL